MKKDHEDLKLTLLNSDPLIAYSFVGATLHISNSSDTECDEEQRELNEEDIPIEEVV